MKNGKRILIIADSMAMPRPETRYDKTWIYLVKQEFPHYDFLDRVERGSISLRLVTEGGGGVDLLELYAPDLVIMQFGFAEGAPRLFKKSSFEYFFLSRILPANLRPKYIQYVKKRRVRDPKITEISPDRFKAHISNYFQRAEAIGANVVVILILEATRLLLSKSPLVQQNIDLYNKIYCEVADSFPNVQCVAPCGDGVDVNDVTVDEYHFDGHGHRMLFGRIKPLVM
ncbi:MAG: hypothetical protein JRD68_07320 [Deltaproteobacteria bacterium]|nr:hypothetical protein [Deltaproteobacteria bacterium]